MSKIDVSFRENLELGRQSSTDLTYNPARLLPIERTHNRQTIGITTADLPFKGQDYWNHYEVSWLNQKGKPQVGIGEISYDCRSPKLIESKSLKLYFNSLNQTSFDDIATLERIICQDLEHCLETPVSVRIHTLENSSNFSSIQNFDGVCLDTLDIACTTYEVEPNFLTTESLYIEESVYSNLLKSNCLVTHQPDWGSVQISYKGRQINHEGLLQYLVSFRNHNEFHEHCIERIFMDILKRCQPEELTVYGRYTRRGGIDINPYRTTKHRADVNNQRFIRQ